MEEIDNYVPYNVIVMEIRDIQRMRQRVKDALMENNYNNLLNLKMNYGSDIDVIIKEEGMKLLKRGDIKEVNLPNYEMETTGIVWISSLLFTNSYRRYLQEKYANISCLTLIAIYDSSRELNILPLQVIEKHCERDYIIMMLLIKPKKDDDGVSHMNVLLIDRVKKEIERFEPYGAFQNTEVDLALNDYAIRNGYTYLDSSTFCPIQSFQTLDEKESKFIRGIKYRKNDQPNGYCAAWSVFYIELRLQNLLLDRNELVQRAIQNLRLEGFNNYIKRYASNLMNELLRRIKNEFEPIDKIETHNFVKKREYIIKKDGKYIPAYFVEKDNNDYIFVLYGPKWVKINIDDVQIGEIKLNETLNFWERYNYLINRPEDLFEKEIEQLFQKKKTRDYLRDARKLHWSKSTH